MFKAPTPVMLFALFFIALFIWVMQGGLVVRYWTRENPLANPLTVSSIQRTTLTLKDGSIWTLDTIQPAIGVSQKELEGFLTVATEQGIVIEGDSIIAEPKFYNSCGTVNGTRKWEGIYCRAKLDEVAILCGYADPVVTEDVKSEYAHWRRSAIFILRQDLNAHATPDGVFSGIGIRYSGQPRLLEASDEDLEYFSSTTKPE